MADSTTNVPQILTSQGQKEATANRDFNSGSPSMLYAIDKIIGLTCYYLGGKVFVASVPTSIANGTLTLTASATCYIRKLDSTGAVSFVTSIPTSWPAANGGYTPLHTVVMGASTYTSWTDHRVGLADLSTTSSTSAPTDATYIVLSANATLSREAVLTAGSGITLTEGGGSPPTILTIAATSTAAKVIQVACSDQSTDITTGTAKVTFRMPYAMTVTAVRASFKTNTGGSPVTLSTIDINEGGASILSTKLTVDSGELTSTTAATPAVISDASLADDAEITIDVDAIGNGATGLVVSIIGT